MHPMLQVCRDSQTSDPGVSLKHVFHYQKLCGLEILYSTHELMWHLRCLFLGHWYVHTCTWKVKDVLRNADIYLQTFSYNALQLEKTSLILTGGSLCHWLWWMKLTYFLRRGWYAMVHWLGVDYCQTAMTTRLQATEWKYDERTASLTRASGRHSMSLHILLKLTKTLVQVL